MSVLGTQTGWLRRQAFGTLYAVSVPDAGEGTLAVLVVAAPQLAAPGKQGESVLSRVWTPSNAQVILSLLQLPASL